MRTLIALAAAAALAACTRSSAGGGSGDAAVPGADSIALERTPCFGTCPTYRVSITSAGRVRFTASDVGDSLRTESDSVDPEQFARLLADAQRAAFDSFPDRIADSPALCSLRATDHQTVIVTVFRPAGAKRVEDYTGCSVHGDPPRLAPELMPLRVFETAIDRTTGAARWARPRRGK